MGEDGHVLTDPRVPGEDGEEEGEEGEEKEEKEETGGLCTLERSCSTAHNEAYT